MPIVRDTVTTVQVRMTLDEGEYFTIERPMGRLGQVRILVESVVCAITSDKVLFYGRGKKIQKSGRPSKLASSVSIHADEVPLHVRSLAETQYVAARQQMPRFVDTLTGARS